MAPRTGSAIPQMGLLTRDRAASATDNDVIAPQRVEGVGAIKSWIDRSILLRAYASRALRRAYRVAGCAFDPQPGIRIP
jgi:hypothetical protein